MSIQPLIRKTFLQAAVRRAGKILMTLLAIAYLTQLGLIMAERGRNGLPARPFNAAGEAILQTGSYLINHPASYIWHKTETPAGQVVLETFTRSAGLLILSLGIAALLGVLLGSSLAITRRQSGAPFVLLLSILGISIPSFMLGMFLWLIDIQAVRWLNVKSLPLTGFGWDAHLIMPVLVLAARPLAQITQITYVTLSDILGQDYIRVARAKGLASPLVLFRHALRSDLVPILTTIGTSLRFSLATLPVVEYFFLWPGVGLTLLDAIQKESAPLVTDLIVSLGLFFLLVNLALEGLFLLLDPRLRQENHYEAGHEQDSFLAGLLELLVSAGRWAADLFNHTHTQPPSSQSPRVKKILGKSPAPLEAPQTPFNYRDWTLRAALRNRPLILGTLMILALASLALFGDRLSPANPYEIHGVMKVDGVISAPPYAPTDSFLWGTDQIGRDIQSLVLWGARQTLSLALFVMLARLLLGAFLGMIAGWWSGGRIDRLVSGAVDVWAAFPITLFAMILIQALGIQQGMSVFIIALSVVGWGEIAQIVRAAVRSIKSQPYIEAAHSVGAGPVHILRRQILPNLIPSILVLASLEMGGVLMLLAELGFLNIFLGGGFKVEIAVDQVAFFSDVPEWGALLANIRGWWQANPWMAWYPSLAFCFAILAFNLWGEGLRRFFDETQVNISRLFNRYTLLVAALVLGGFIWTLRSTTPLGIYQPDAALFDPTRTLIDIGALAHPALQGREAGSAGAQAASQYIARQMEAIGLQPAGEKDTYIQSFTCPVYHLRKEPTLVLPEDLSSSLVYRQDFVELAGTSFLSFGKGSGPVVGVALGPDPGSSSSDPYKMLQQNLADKIILLSQPADLQRANLFATAGVLIANFDPTLFQKKYLYQSQDTSRGDASVPVMYITPALADRLLTSTGSSLASLELQAASLPAGKVAQTPPGPRIQMEVDAGINEDPYDNCYNVIGFIPGSGAEMGEKGKALDNQVIVVSAYYDGLGVGDGGILYTGASDNASGVAAMLELARAMKASHYQPKKTVIFTAWAGGERGVDISLFKIMNAKTGFNSLSIEAVLELSGMAGGGPEIDLGQGSSFRLVQLIQDAAGRLGYTTTSRGRGPHFGQVTQPGFGGRTGLTAYVSSNGSDKLAHMPLDNLEAINLDCLRRTGQTTLLSLLVLSREVNY